MSMGHIIHHVIMESGKVLDHKGAANGEGSVVGGLGGAGIGFLVGGPLGAVAGAIIGAAAGAETQDNIKKK